MTSRRSSLEGENGDTFVRVSAAIDSINRGGKDAAMPKVVERLSGFHEMIKSAAACVAFMFVGPALMVLNKHIMQDRDFKFPMALSCIGLVASSLVANVAVSSGYACVRPDRREVVSGKNWCRTILPMAIAKAVTLAFGNGVYLYLGLGFIQMLKAFCPCIVLLFMYFAGVEMPTRASIWCAAVIVSGTFMEVKGELHATAMGLTMMACTEVAEATFLVLGALLLQNNKFSVVESMYFLAGPSAVVLGGCALFTELQPMVASGRHMVFLEQPWEILGTAVLGVLVNFLSFFVVQLTSPATLKILNTVRGIGLVAFGVVFYGEECSVVQLVGYAVCLIGFIGYNYFQLRKTSAAAVEDWADNTFGACLRCQCGNGSAAATSSLASSDAEADDEEEHELVHEARHEDPCSHELVQYGKADEINV